MHFSDYKFKILRKYARIRRFFTDKQTRKQSRWLIFAFVALLILFWNIRNYYANRTNIWEIVPEDAVFLAQTTAPLRLLSKTDSSFLWQNLRQIPYFDSLHAASERLSAFFGEELKGHLADKEISLSLHQTAKDNFDFILYAPVEEKKREIFLSLARRYAEKNQLILEKRTYAGTEIYDVKQTPSLKMSFSFLFYKDYFAGGKTPYLLEEIIRKENKEENSFFLENYKQLSINDVNAADGKIYIQPAKFFKAFYALYDKEDGFLPAIHRSELTKLKFSLTERDMYFSGEAQCNETHFLSLFNRQKPVAMGEIKNYIPLNTALFYHFGLSDVPAFFEKQRGFIEKFQGKFFAEIKQFQSETDFPYQDFTACLSSEIALAEAESEQKMLRKAAFARLKNPQVMTEILNELSEKKAVDKIFETEYKSWVIRKIDQKELPSLLFGSLFTGFPECYYTIADGKFLIFGNSLQAVKDISDAQLTEENWAKSIKYHQLFKKTEAESNFTVIADIPRFWNDFTQNMSGSAKGIFETNKNTLLKFDNTATQFTFREDNQFRLNSILSLHGNALKQSVQNFALAAKANFDTDFARACEIVKNHTDKSEEIFIQDNQNNIHLLSKDGKILWSRTTDGRIVGKISQIDLFKNGKLQYIFASKNFIYAFDRLGRPVENFPIELPEDIQTDVFSLIFDEQKRSYRFLIADSGGLLAMYEQDGNRSDAWKRINLGESLASEVSFVKIGIKEFFIIPHRNGLVNVLDENGKSRNNFPIKINDAYLADAMLVEDGGRIGNTNFTFFTQNGETVKFSPEAIVLKRTQSVAPEGNFFFAKDKVKKRSGILIRQEKNRLFVMNQHSTLIFEKVFANESAKIVEYYNFGAHNEIICIFDTKEKNTYIFNRSGELINRKPIKSDNIAVISFDEAEKKYNLYRTQGNEIFFHFFY